MLGALVLLLTIGVLSSFAAGDGAAGGGVVS